MFCNYINRGKKTRIWTEAGRGPARHVEPEARRMFANGGASPKPTFRLERPLSVERHMLATEIGRLANQIQLARLKEKRFFKITEINLMPRN